MYAPTALGKKFISVVVHLHLQPYDDVIEAWIRELISCLSDANLFVVGDIESGSPTSSSYL